MQSAIFDTPVLKSESLKTKFDICIVSNSFVALIGDYIEARIVQQLHYWSHSKYGVVIKGLRWIYKPIREWLSEAFVGFTSSQLRKAIANLIKKGILLREHLFKEHHGHNYAPSNRTYYYSVNYEELEKLFLEQEMAESTENVSFAYSTKQFCPNSEKPFCDSQKNNTDITSIEDISRELSHPTLPCEGEEKKDSNQEKELYSSNLELPKISEVDSVNSRATGKETNVGQVEQNINQNTCTNIDEVQIESNKLQKTDRPSPKLKVTKTKQKRENKAPWKDETERAQFYRALIQALPIVANSHSPQGLAKTIMAQLKRGEEHTYWDDFKAGLPIGASTKPEWEIEPGVPYPMFIEYLTEKIKRGNNTQTNEQARNEVFRILSQPRQATAFWGQFKRSVVNAAEQVSRDRALGVSNPSTPVWTRERIEPSVEEAAEAGKKIMAVNGDVQMKIASGRVSSSPPLPTSKSQEQPDPWIEDDQSQPSTLDSKTDDQPQLSMREMLEARGVKGFCKQMPKVSRAEAEAEAKAESEAIARAQMNRKTNINQMSLNEINELLTDPIVRKELTPQIIFNDKFDLVTDNLGEVLAVSINQEYLDSGGI